MYYYSDPMITGVGPSPIKTERGETSAAAAAAAGARINNDQDGIVAIDYGNSEDHAKIDSFPPGYRFCPRDSELVIYYLQKKVLGEPLPMNKIMEVNLYKYDPQTLAAMYEKYGEGEWYFFTPRDKKYPNGTRPNRAAGNGYWKATGADKVIKDESTDSEVVIGLRKALVYYMGRPPKGEKTDWIMHEFRLKSADDSPPRAPRTDMRLDDYVLCRIYNKTQKPKNRLIPYFSGKKKQAEAEAEADDQDTLPLSPAAAIIDDQDDPLPLALPSPPSPASAIATPTYHHHETTMDHYMAPPSFHVHQYHHHHQQLWQPLNNCGQCYHDLPAVPAIVDYTSYNYGGSSEASFTNNNSMFNAEWSSNKDDLGQVDLSHLFY